MRGGHLHECGKSDSCIKTKSMMPEVKLQTAVAANLGLVSAV